MYSLTSKSTLRRTFLALRNLYLFLIDFIFPRHCPICDDFVPFTEVACPHCMKKIVYIKPPRCMKCGKRLEDEQREFCHDCSANRHLFLAGRALYDYHSVSQSLYRFKYEKRQEYAQFYGQELSAYLGDVIQTWKADALVPVPIHFTRKHIRGFNQANLIARELGWQLDIPVKTRLLKRVRKTLPQKELDPLERQNNLKNAFKLRQYDVKLKTIIMIDDIYTTGATIDACAAVLKAAGAERIFFITLAIGKGM